MKHFYLALKLLLYSALYFHQFKVFSIFITFLCQQFLQIIKLFFLLFALFTNKAYAIVEECSNLSLLVFYWLIDDVFASFQYLKQPSQWLDCAFEQIIVSLPKTIYSLLILTNHISKSNILVSKLLNWSEGGIFSGRKYVHALLKLGIIFSLTFKIIFDVLNFFFLVFDAVAEILNLLMKLKLLCLQRGYIII